MIFILDRIQNQVWAFDHSGRFTFKVGKKGQGPGEYENPMRIYPAFNQGVVVQDMLTIKAHLFNAKGEWERSISLRGNQFMGTLSMVWAEEDALYLGHVMSPSGKVPQHIYCELEGDKLKPVFGFGTRLSIEKQFMDKTQSSLPGDGIIALIDDKIWVSKIGTTDIFVYYPDGVLLAEVTKQAPRNPDLFLTQEDLDYIVSSSEDRAETAFLSIMSRNSTPGSLNHDLAEKLDVFSTDTEGNPFICFWKLKNTGYKNSP